MNTRLAHYFLIACTVFFLCSCKNISSKNHGPIVLGDSSTIITENDTKKLRDLVTELHPEITSSESTDTTANKDEARQGHADTGKKSNAPVVKSQPETPTNGLIADFGVVSVLIGNVNAKLSGNPNLLHANGAVYTLVNGTINGSIMKLTGNVTKVVQRYQSIIVLKTGSVTLPVESLSTTSDWEPLNGGNNTYRITGLDESSLDYADDEGREIRDAVTRAARRQRMSRRKIEELVSSLHNVRYANQKPLFVTLRSVMWKIDGKDEKGRYFSKQIRIDVPM